MNRLWVIVPVLPALVGAVWGLSCGDAATVSVLPTSDPPRPAAVTITPGGAELGALGLSVQLAAEVRDQNGQVMQGQPVVWSSDDTLVASVDSTGLVTALDSGAVTIAAMAGTVAGTATVTVEKSPDRAVLVALFDATVGPNWVENTNWLTDAPLWEWYGVTVENGRVTALDLSGNGLSGTLPAEIGLMSELRNVDLQWNDLRGPLPLRLEGLPLRSIYLRYAGRAGDLCVPDVPGFVDWLSAFPVNPGAAGHRAVFLPCDRERPSPIPGPAVRVVYAIPTDRAFRQDYSDGIRLGLEVLQWWFADQLGGPTFTVLTDEPEICSMPESEAWYAETRGGAWERVFHAVKDHCVPDIWAPGTVTWVYADVWDVPKHVVMETTSPKDCFGGSLGRGGTGGGGGVMMVGAADLHGLVTPHFRQCGYHTGVDRWIGGSGHEGGHSFGLPHPCDAIEATGAPCPDSVIGSLMQGGYGDFPHTNLLPAERKILLAHPFIR